jgi:hypothetical protein
MKMFISSFNEDDKRELPDLEVYLLGGGYSTWEDRFGNREDLVYLFFNGLFNVFRLK